MRSYKKLLSILFMSFLIFTACSNDDEKNEEDNKQVKDTSQNTGGSQSSSTDNDLDDQASSPNSSTLSRTLTPYSLEEIAKHDQEGDCWLVLEGQVYDVSDFVPRHPGEDAILQGCGLPDATPLFEGVGHSQSAKLKTSEFLIGRVEE